MNSQATEGIYLDHAATSIPRSPVAIASVQEVINLGNANRGMYSSATTASRIVASAREIIARLVGTTTNTHRVCFLPSTTVALNQAIFGLKPIPRKLAIDPLAHNATYRPLASFSQRSEAEYYFLPCHPSGRIDVDKLRKNWVTGTDVIIITHASNVNGVIQPVAEIIEIARKFAAKVIVDAAQTVGIIDTSILAEADLIAFGAHKGLRSLPGIGALVIANDTQIEPLIYGGTGGDSSSEFMPPELPQALEAGTLNLPGIASFAASAENYLQNPQSYAISAADVVTAISSTGAVLVPTDISHSLPVMSFTIPSLPVWEAADMLERCFSIQLRAGLHCAPIAHKTLGTLSSGTLRVSVGYTTTEADLLYLSQAISAICKIQI